MEASQAQDKDEEKEFLCSNCRFKMKYHYFGRKPPFVKSLMLLEDAYVMKDPFSTDVGLITIGAHCSLCSKPVCISNDCSLFFSKRFCMSCVTDHMEEFPTEIQQYHCLMNVGGNVRCRYWFLCVRPLDLAQDDTRNKEDEGEKQRGRARWGPFPLTGTGSRVGHPRSLIRSLH